jgi:hypothetical protein
MKVIAIANIRCHEYDMTTHVCAPENVTNEEIDKLLKEAQNEYLEELDRISKDLPTLPAYQEVNCIHIVDDNLTVGEVKKRYKEYQDIEKQRREMQFLQDRGFLVFLRKKGFRTIYEAIDPDDENNFTLDWEHRHGQELKYEF